MSTRLMAMIESSRQTIRGLQDLYSLWGELPAAALSYKISDLPDDPEIAALGDKLRGYAWREHCAGALESSCIEKGRNCTAAGTGRCRADTLFPMYKGGGAPSWRMATLFLQWLPSRDELRLIALGEMACAELGWAARCLRRQNGMRHFRQLDVTEFAQMELRDTALRWRLRLVTDWLYGETRSSNGGPPDAALLEKEIAKSLRIRAHKLTALCTQDNIWQRLGGHLVHHVADRLLADDCVSNVLNVEALHIEAEPLVLRSDGNGRAFKSIAWRGEATLQIDELLLPWLSVLAVCGGGEHPDKGFGAVELVPLPTEARV